MKSILAVSMVVLALASGCATSPSTADKKVAGTAATPAAKAGCVRDTGSRIDPKAEDCRGAGGTYSQDDIERTGEFNTADALRKLDPSVH